MPNAREALEKREIWALRMTDTEKEQIRARAKRADLSMSRYMIHAALGELADPSLADERLDEHHERLVKLERFCFGDSV